MRHSGVRHSVASSRPPHRSSKGLRETSEKRLSQLQSESRSKAQAGRYELPCGMGVVGHQLDTSVSVSTPRYELGLGRGLPPIQLAQTPVESKVAVPTVPKQRPLKLLPLGWLDLIVHNFQFARHTWISELDRSFATLDNATLGETESTLNSYHSLTDNIELRLSVLARDVQERVSTIGRLSHLRTSTSQTAKSTLRDVRSMLLRLVAELATRTVIIFLSGTTHQLRVSSHSRSSSLPALRRT